MAARHSTAARVAEQTEIRRALLRNGYSPFPCAGKTKQMFGWEQIQATEALIDDWADQLKWVSTAVHVGPGRLIGLDFDIDDADVLADFKQRIPAPLWEKLQSSPVRYGGGVKEMWFARLAEGEQDVPKFIKTGQWGPEGGPDHKVELFLRPNRLLAIDGARLVDDDKTITSEYRWRGGVGLHNTPLDALPELTMDDVRALADAAVAAFQAVGWDRLDVDPPADPKSVVYDLTADQTFTLQDGEVLTVPELIDACHGGTFDLFSWLPGHHNRGDRCHAFLHQDDGGLCIRDHHTEITHRLKSDKHLYRERMSEDMAATVARLGEKLRERVAQLREQAKAGDTRAQAVLEIAEAPEREQAAREAVLEEEIGPRPDLAHDALAMDLGERKFDQDARFVAKWSQWLLWDGVLWEADDRMTHMTMTREFLRARADEVEDWANKMAAKMTAKDGEKAAKEAGRLVAWAEQEARALRSKSTIAAVSSLAASNPASAAGPDDFDSDLFLLGTPAGTVDLRTGRLREARRGDMITKTTSVAPADGRPERWLAFLDRIFEGKQEVIDFMQRAAGYALTGMTTEHKLLFLYGTGRNGKGVFLNTLVSIWKDYARKAAAETFLASQQRGHPTDIAGLKGARLVMGSELPKGRTWDESIIKDLTGGDRMTARLMRQDFFDFDPQMTLMIAGNNRPSLRGVDEAMRARMVLIPFEVTIPEHERDPELPARLLAEEGGQILQWAIKGALEWQRRGLDAPETIRAASDTYLDEEDVAGQFMAECLLEARGEFVTTTAIHAAFRSWCDTQGLHPWTMMTLQKELTQRGLAPARTAKGRGFTGWKVRQPERRALIPQAMRPRHEEG
jgi:P4 family phage/plasmid primase-like protien